MAKVLVFLVMVLTYANMASGYGPDERKGRYYLRHEIVNNFPFVFTLTPRLLDRLYLVWPKRDRDLIRPIKDKEKRREYIYQYYGLYKAPWPNKGYPLGFTPVKGGRKAYLNCLSCHGGMIDGKFIPGMATKDFDFHSLAEDITAYRFRRIGSRIFENIFLKKFFKIKYANSKVAPRGTSNAQGFSAVVMGFRKLDMNWRVALGFILRPKVFSNLHSSTLKAPAWWDLKFKNRLYIDAFASKTPRALMQFLLGNQTDAKGIKRLDPKFKKIAKYIDATKAPAYPYPDELDADKVAKGKKIYHGKGKCFECHGSFEKEFKYKMTVTPIGTVKTDSHRLKYGMTPEFRKYYHKSWLNYYGKRPTVIRPKGYVASPLKGVWAKAPYLHNGSVPDMYTLLTPSKRPTYWKKTHRDGLNRKYLGLKTMQFRYLPFVYSDQFRRTFYNTTYLSNGNQGHLWGEDLSEIEKFELIEFLKTI